MSEEKTLEQRVSDLENKVQELQRLLKDKADSQNVNKQIFGLLTLESKFAKEADTTVQYRLFEKSKIYV